MPYVTIGIVGICVVVQVILSIVGSPNDEGASPLDLRLEAADYILEHPHLSVSPTTAAEILEAFPATVREGYERNRSVALRYRNDPVYVSEVLARARGDDDPREELFEQLYEELERSGEDRSEAFRRTARAYTSRLPGAEARLFDHLSRLGEDGEREEQRQLDALLERYTRAEHADPYQAYGAKAGQLLSYRSLTHLFVHGGWLHLLGNMLFLWLVGFNVEDRWGRVVFSLFYLTAGALAAFAHFNLAHPQLTEFPLVGASGAIAAVMGVFLVHFWKTKIHVFWWSFIRFGTFEISAYLALPLWFLHQLLLAWLYQDAPVPIAYWAHAAGFAFGLGLAGLFRVSGIEARFLSGRIERADIVYEHDDRHEPEVAFARAGEEAPRHPPRDRWRPFVEALGAVRAAPVEETRRAWLEARDALERGQLSPSGHLRVARALQSAELFSEAFDELRDIIRRHGLNGDTVAAALLLAENLEAQGRGTEAVAVLDKYSALPGLEPAWTNRLRTLRAQLSP